MRFIPDAFKADVWSVMDYYPYGMLMPERSANMQEMELHRAYSTDTLEVITWTDKVVEQPDEDGKFQTQLDGSNTKWKARAWTTSTDQEGAPHQYSSSVATASPISFSLSGGQDEMHLAGLGYKSMRIEYLINATTQPLMAVNDSFTLTLTPIFDGSYYNTRVEIRDGLADALIEDRNIFNPPNNIGVPVTLRFGVRNSSALKVIVRADFSNPGSYAPDTATLGGVANWTNGIYLRRFHLTLHKRNVNQEVVSDTSEYAYRPKYPFGFNGMYRDDEVNGIGNSYNFGARLLDVRLCSWLRNGPLAPYYPAFSPYNFAGNNPVCNIDPDGKRIYYYVSTKGTGKDVRPVINIVFTGAVVDLSGKWNLNNTDVADIAQKLNGYAGNWLSGKMDARGLSFNMQDESGNFVPMTFAEVDYQVHFQYRAVQTMSEVQEDDHLLVLADFDKKFGETRELYGIASYGGKIAYVDADLFTGWYDGITDWGYNIAIHEIWTHNSGLKHTRTKGLITKTLPGYFNNQTTPQERRTVFNRYQSGTLNKGKPTITMGGVIYPNPYLMDDENQNILYHVDKEEMIQVDWKEAMRNAEKKQ